MTFFTSVELDNIDGIEYLHYFLNPKFSFKAKLNGEEIEQNEIYIKAPTMAQKDVYDLRKCSLVISKFEELNNDKLAKQFLALTEEQKSNLLGNVKELEDTKPSEQEAIEGAKSYIKGLLKSCKYYEVENSNYFTEFDKIIFFLEQRLHRDIEGSLFKASFTLFDNLLAQKQFLIEEIFAEYVGFFFNHFPSESLAILNKK